MKNKKLWIDGCAGSELKDTQGETLSIEGADISELEAGRAFYNDNHGKGFANHLGMITEAKKIFKAEDCENERHTYYWDKIKAPYIYAKGYLHNNEDHPNARAAAAILRNIHREDCPLKVKMSVEGGVLARGISDPTRLAQTKLAGVALTFTPANTATLVEPLNLDKSSQDWTADQQLIKSVLHLAETNIPSFRHITRHASANTILDNINKIQALAKTLGVDIQVSTSTPEVIMKNASISKVEQNILKINSLIKTINPKTGLAVKPPRVDVDRAAIKAKEQAVKQIGSDRYQQGIGALNIESKPDIPTRATATVQPKVETVALTSGDAFKQKQANIAAAQEARKAASATPVITKPTLVPQETTFPSAKSPRPATIEDHANIAMKDPGYLNSLRNKLLANPTANKDHVEQFLNMIDSHGKVAKSALYSEAKEKLVKAMTAGFGGSGSPGDLTGGGVFQSESLEDHRAKKSEGLKYISCDNCGDEQVYMKHQVRCRECGRNYSFDKLNKFI